MSPSPDPARFTDWANPRRGATGGAHQPTPRERPAGAGASRGGRGPTVALGVLAGALTAVAALPTWATAVLADPVLGHRNVDGTGATVAPAVIALGLTAMAAAVVAAAGGRLARPAAGVVLVGAGLGVGWSVLSVLRQPEAAVAGLGSGSIGRSTGAALTSVEVTIWPWLSLLGALLVLAAGLMVLLWGRDWAAGSTRYDSPLQDSSRSSPPSTGRAQAVDDWDSLSRGEDPTD